MQVSANRSAGAGGRAYVCAFGWKACACAWLSCPGRATLDTRPVFINNDRQHDSEVSSFLVSPQRCRRSLQIKPHPLLGSHPFGPRLIDIRAYELVQRPDDLVILVGTTLGSFPG
jgi:hypothetical protein